MGAAVSYAAIIVVVFWHTRRRWIRVIAVAIGVIIPLCVGFSRLYRGMHYFSDVIFGALLGGASVIGTVIVLRHAAVEYTPDDHPQADQQNGDREHIEHQLPNPAGSVVA
jgi:hypothetical protein